MKRIVIWTGVVFALATLLTMQLEAPRDGVTRFGFPFTFYDQLGGKCENCYQNFGFKLPNLLIDIGFAAMVVTFIVMLTRRITRNNRDV